mgnify:CR=1 FL=1
MKHLKTSIALFAILSLPASTVWGQTIGISVPDTAMQKVSQIITMDKKNETKIFKIAFDTKGYYVYNDTAFSEDKRYFVSFGEGLIPLRMKKGEKTTIKALPGKDGKSVVCTYKGYAADAYVLRDSIRQGYRYDRYFSTRSDKAETLKNYEEKLKMLDAYHDRFLNMAGKIKDEILAEELRMRAECEWIRYRLALMRVKDRNDGINIVDDAAFQELLDRIDITNPVYESYSLISEYIKGKVRADMYTDPIGFGNSFVKEACARITNPQMKQRLLVSAAAYVISCVTGDDIDRFWLPFKAVAHPEAVQMFEAKIASMKSTKAGTPAPDSEFTDADGKVHSFSEFRGKLLYVDFWATWCGPCKMEIPYLAKLVERFKGNDKVVFISISTDTNRKAWENLVAKDKPQWPQYIASKDQHAKLSKEWGITAIPRFIMINPDGTINTAEAPRPSDPATTELIEKLTR